MAKAEKIYTRTELIAAIEQAIEIERDMVRRKAELTLLRSGIKDTMLAANLDEVSVGENRAAKIVRQDQYSWDVETLKGVLPARKFKALVPPKPDGTALRIELDRLAECRESDPLMADEYQSLRACAKLRRQVNLVLEHPLEKVVKTKANGKVVGERADVKAAGRDAVSEERALAEAREAAGNVRRD